ncbi:hypothetical protein THIOM_004739 [Candidatus Thiomargarita nelsonii]|uniref:Uncharacterized protein n=1 Tax=Candidatus Thiomargarita nelsonii TaxID=1003181 RepID=A0A176RV70_9GAMM|nr:hypothetical protein THIOM_004739 [Candidatus Thiomargarita nelsonii]
MKEAEEFKKELINYMEEENAVSLEHSRVAAARCIRLIESNQKLNQLLEYEPNYEVMGLGTIILAAYLGEKINPLELESPSCQEIREIIYQLYDDEVGES